MHEGLDQTFPFSLVRGEKLHAIAFHAFGAGIFQDHPQGGKLGDQHLLGLGFLQSNGEVPQAFVQAVPNRCHLVSNELDLLCRKL